MVSGFLILKDHALRFLCWTGKSFYCHRDCMIFRATQQAKGLHTGPNQQESQSSHV